MKFGTFPIKGAEHVILAHAVATPTGRYKKGRQLTKTDLNALQAAGVTEVMGALLEPGDVAEDEAAERLARAVSGPGCTVTHPFTGRCNLTASIPGILTLNSQTVDAINNVDEAITLATLAPYAAVEAGQTIATAKIIPFSCRAADLELVEKTAKNAQPVMAVQPYKKKSIHLVSTVLPETKISVLDKSRDVLRQRLQQCHNDLADEIRCSHTTPALQEALDTVMARTPDLVLIFGASAITDRGDIIPAAITANGGEVAHMGMPVDPGNLLLLAHHGDVPVIGLPGCARSPKLNGFDWVLERLLADVPVTKSDVVSMGVGGLLKEIPSRPQPREEPPLTKDTPSIGAVILAAGQSRRMGAVNKLLQNLDGKPMVRHVADAVLGAGITTVVVVTGHESSEVEKALAPLPVSFVHNPNYTDGLSSSLKTGIVTLRENAPHTDAVLVCLGDMPRLTAAHLRQIVDAFDPSQGHRIVVPTHQGKRGNPVIWSRHFFDDIHALKGDVGARALIGQNEDSVVDVPLNTEAIFLDIDTPDALARQRNEVSGDDR